uniref:Tetraspanin-9 n=2 Tax=Phasianus colchicus TaxID=9054 RepID=A0A669QGQ4_PHACC
MKLNMYKSQITSLSCTCFDKVIQENHFSDLPRHRHEDQQFPGYSFLKNGSDVSLFTVTGQLTGLPGLFWSSLMSKEFKKCDMTRGCLCCLKYMMFLFNLIFWLCGCGLLGVGIWLSVSQGNFATFSPSFPSLSAANLVIAFGTVIMVTGFLGCLGAIKENKCLLLSFFIVLLIILLAELILLILFFVYMDKVSESAKKDLKEGMKLYNSENNVGLKNAWNIIQAEMKCCGVNDFTDWYPVLGENIVPDRCCTENSQDCGWNSTELVWKTGCYERVMTWFDENKHVLGSTGMCILIMQILGMAFSMTLFQQIHRTGKKYDA